MIAELPTSQSWRDDVASWIVQSGCLYFVAWGVECEAWHDAVDWTVLETFDFGDIPDDEFVMTTWHDKEPLVETLWFTSHSALHPNIDLQETLIMHIAHEEQGAAMLRLYNDSQIPAHES